MSDRTDRARVKWAGLAKRITEHLLERHERLEDLCPSSPLATEDRRSILKAICSLNRTIAKLAEELGAVESESGLGAMT